MILLVILFFNHKQHNGTPSVKEALPIFIVNSITDCESLFLYETVGSQIIKVKIILKRALCQEFH